MVIAMKLFTFSNMIHYCFDNYMLILGFIGQGFFFGRFFVQWIASERQGISVVPLAFWYFSIGGGALLLIYSIQRKDPVYILGQGGRSRHISAQSLPDSQGTLQGEGLEFS